MTGDRETLCRQLEAICDQAGELEERFAPELAAVHPDFAESARNLVHYLALRQLDIRELQGQLSVLGLSSLGAAEQHVLASLCSVHYALQSLSGGSRADERPDAEEFERARQWLGKHSDDLLGTNPDGRIVEIMVTLPVEAADSDALLRDLLTTGMDIARINCAHDSRTEWTRMVEHVHMACRETGRSCRIFLDLAGPKVRTGPLRPGPGMLRIRPRRDGLGRVVAPKRVRFVAEDTRWPGRKQAVVPVPAELIAAARVGDSLRFRDTRGRKRSLKVAVKDEKGLVVEANKRAYLAEGTKLTLVQRESGDKLRFVAGSLLPADLPIILFAGDILVLERSGGPGEPAVTDDDGSIMQSAHIACLPAEALDYVSVGATVLLNDGKIRGRVEESDGNGVRIRIDQAKPSGSRLRANQSINFPGSGVGLRGLMETDRNNLDFVVEHADAVCLSFVRSPAEIIEVQQALAEISDRRIGIVPKIETEEGFRELPRILLAAMRNYPAGIMIARGDLAVECGWERLAEIQEEILWMCEAAHMPVIWATQVLESEAKKGLPSRAEITDAAMSQRADCVMLNKGPHILSAIRMLDDILRRMQDHQLKKAPRLRKLSISEFRQEAR